MALNSILPPFIKHVLDSVVSNDLRPGLHPIPETKPLTIEAALLPPLLYYLALLFLPPAPPPAIDTFAISSLRNVTALLASFLFFRLPLAYHVPQSIGLTYQLGLVGLYGGLRVLDAFFVSKYLFGRIPKRVTYNHAIRPGTPDIPHIIRREKVWSDGGLKDPFSGNALHSAASGTLTPKEATVEPKRIVTENSTAPMANDLNHAAAGRRRTSMVEETSYFLHRALKGPDPIPVYETAHTEPNYPHTFMDRASWALELELSMRGMGFTWTTADVRHTRKTWLPTPMNRLHSIFLNVLPTILIAYTIISTIYARSLASLLESPTYNPFPTPANPTPSPSPFDSLSIPTQLLLTLALGTFLMSAFSLGHSIFAILLSPLSPHPLAFFPPLYTTRVWNIYSVRQFWSFGWHRLFARLFLVWGVWPGEWLERMILRKEKNEPADVGKVLGAFVCSAFVHAFSVRGVMQGDWSYASGEAKFFALNGVAVVVEGLVGMAVKAVRKRYGMKEKSAWDKWVGMVWWLSVVTWSGRNFARGWVRSGLVREMAFQ